MAGKGKGKGKVKKGKDKKRNEKNRIEEFEPRSLPENAVKEILLRFPVKSLLRFRCVSKKWRNQIDSIEFRKMHLSYLNQGRYVDDDQFLVVNREYSMRSVEVGCQMNVLSCYDDYKSFASLKSSCDLDIDSMYFSSFSYTINGIVCVVRNDREVYLCNPALREFHQLPNLPCFPVELGVTDSYLLSGVGIGFDDADQDFTLVQFLQPCGDSDPDDLKCIEYHFITESWTSIQMPPAFVSANASTMKKRFSSFEKLYPSFFSHGCIHWCIQWSYLILTLNANTKSFQEIQFPKGWKDYGYDDCPYLLSIDSSSIALFGTRGHDIHNYDIWVMKEYGVADSWVKQYFLSDYTIPGLPPPEPGLPPISCPLSFWRKDKIFLLTSWGKLICYDLGKGQLYGPPLRGQCDSTATPLPMMKAVEVMSSGEKKLLFLPTGEDEQIEPPRLGQSDTTGLPHPDMQTLQVVSCSGSLVSVYES